MTETVLDLRGLRRDYAMGGPIFGRRTLQALRGIDLTISRGETLGLVGESGSGKSTLARLILGIEAPSAGEVHIAGAPLAARDRKARARLIQPVFQDPYSSLNPRITIAGIIAAPLEVQGGTRARDRMARVRELADLVGLPPHLLAAYPAQLSGGQRQRVAIARALIVEPEILICDEPTSALDVSVQAQILNLLDNLKRQMGLTMLLITHNLSVVRHLADRVAVMYLGRIVEEGLTRDLLGAPRHPYTAALVNAALPARPGATLPDLGLGTEIPSPLSPPPGCAFHPRCPRADTGLCRRTEPQPQPRAAGQVTCHHPDILAPAA